MGPTPSKNKQNTMPALSGEAQLKQAFQRIDVNNDGTLDAAELLQAFEKIGEKPTVAECKAMIEEVSPGNDCIRFPEFVVLHEKITSGQVPSVTGLAKLIKSAWEDVIANNIKTVKKNEVTTKVSRTATEATDEAPQGEKYKLGKKT